MKTINPKSTSSKENRDIQNKLIEFKKEIWIYFHFVSFFLNSATNSGDFFFVVALNPLIFILNITHPNAPTGNLVPTILTPFCINFSLDNLFFLSIYQ